MADSIIRSSVWQRFERVVQWFTCVYVVEVGIAIKVPRTLRLGSVVHLDVIDNAGNGQWKYIVNQSIAPAPDSVHFHAVNRPIAKDKLLRFRRVKEALKHASGQMGLEWIAVDGSKTLYLALLCVASNAFGVYVVDGVFASVT